MKIISLRASKWSVTQKKVELRHFTSGEINEPFQVHQAPIFSTCPFFMYTPNKEYKIWDLTETQWFAL